MTISLFRRTPQIRRERTSIHKCPIKTQPLSAYATNQRQTNCTDACAQPSPQNRKKTQRQLLATTMENLGMLLFYFFDLKKEYRKRRNACKRFILQMDN
jgi:hypothetical protein